LHFVRYVVSFLTLVGTHMASWFGTATNASASPTGGMYFARVIANINGGGPNYLACSGDLQIISTLDGGAPTPGLLGTCVNLNLNRIITEIISIKQGTGLLKSSWIFFQLVNQILEVITY
jgi:hypothetical protein